MRFSLLHKLVAYLLSGLGLGALSLGSELSDAALAFVFAGYAGSYFAEEKLHSRSYYGPLWTAAVVAFLCLQIVRGLFDEPTLAMAIEFAAFLQVSRLWNRRTAVDYQQIAVLSFLHLTAATVLSTNLSYAMIFIGFVVATPWMLALSHLRREIEGNYPATSDGDQSSRNAVARVLSSRRVVGPSFLLGTALLSLPLFAMTLGIFVIIPRVGQGFLSFRREAGQRVAGFGSQVELGGFGVIRDDPTVVLRVMPEPKVDQKAPRLSLRLRGTSFDRYDGRRWSRSAGEMLPLPRLPSSLYPIQRMPDASDKALRIVLDHLDEPVVFLPIGTVALSIPPRVSRGESVLRELVHSPGLDVRYDHPDGLGLMYTAYVSQHPRDQAIVPLLAEPRWKYLALPGGHARVAELARKVAGDAQTDQERAHRIERFLKSGEFTYSLEQPNVGDKPPLEAFLFDAKRGHCEYFSSAMAVMLRSLGVPTRNVTGFVGGQYNPYGGYYALRQGDAHSWVEAYLNGRGWTAYDPTPSSRATVGPRENLWADINAVIDALRTRWMTSVVGYDLRIQVGMLRRIGRWVAARRTADGSGPAMSGRPSLQFRQALKSTARWGGLLLVLGALVWLGWRLLERPVDAKGRSLSRAQARAVRLYTELESALRKRGHARPVTRTPLEHARALQAEGFAQSKEVGAVTQRYLEARYGGRPLHGQELRELRHAVDRVRKAA